MHSATLISLLPGSIIDKHPAGIFLSLSLFKFYQVLQATSGGFRQLFLSLLYARKRLQLSTFFYNGGVIIEPKTT